ncbi:MAG TPA: hypothetical protein QF353_05525 [Gammaproteobacteria bacterium]|nr:hypothetical protein [Gammaproteobacteria bacterium]
MKKELRSQGGVESLRDNLAKTVRNTIGILNDYMNNLQYQDLRKYMVNYTENAEDLIEIQDKPIPWSSAHLKVVSSLELLSIVKVTIAGMQEIEMKLDGAVEKEELLATIVSQNNSDFQIGFEKLSNGVDRLDWSTVKDVGDLITRVNQMHFSKGVESM